ncbi:hypothetical protein AVEN_132660-1 [Araneus ventricosus]|uniref:Uncharacterized protein n=1 Tax=Araneus ventricosus TaxID=182803 RepID=A0A4Y2AV90_ARAVE|nr:hypothetical protein AVEN_132660-1 [Araneus ventricosus]
MAIFTHILKSNQGNSDVPRLEVLRWDMLPHQSYSLNAATNVDCHLYQSRHSGLSGQRFGSYDDIKSWIDEMIFFEATRIFPAHNPFIA